MNIITVPDVILRKKSIQVDLTPKIVSFIKKLESTLKNHKDPEGVGLAAPQVGKNIRIFATNELKNRKTRHFINPVIVDNSEPDYFGPDKKHPDLEGCLSIPHIYGPVPRYRVITLKFYVFENNTFIQKTETFKDFDARVIQHEYDHLDGILFTDYILKYNLPVFKEVNNKLIELENRKILEKF